MQDSSNLLTISGSEELMVEMREFLEQMPEADHLISERRNLDGDTATWVAVISLVLAQVPHVLTFIANVRRPSLPTHIKFGDIEIVNPTEEDLKVFRELVLSKIQDQTEKE